LSADDIIGRWFSSFSKMRKRLFALCC
jgi:hypothetical protein